MNRTFKLLNTTAWHCAFISIIADKEVEVGVLVPAWDLPGLQNESQDSLGYVDCLKENKMNKYREVKQFWSQNVLVASAQSWQWEFEGGVKNWLEEAKSDGLHTVQSQKPST